MAKTKSKKLKVKDLQKIALDLMKKNTGWEKTEFDVFENRVFPDGYVVHKFKGKHPGLSHLSPITIYLNNAGEEVDYNQLTKPEVKPGIASTQLIKKLEKLDKKNDYCKTVAEMVNQYLSSVCETKFNSLDHCHKEEPCPCSGGTGTGGQQKVDLVILIDTSGSMQSKGQAISNAAIGALSQNQCPTDLRVTWLGIEGTFGGTNFTQTCRNYLTSIGCTQFEASTQNEEGADSITDLSNCFDWRPGACRSIFYLSDEPLDQGAPQNTSDDAATVKAITAAQTNNVTVFAHLVQGGFHTNAATIQNFTDLCQQTGGQETIGGSGTEAQYTQLLNMAICDACGGCKKVDWSNIKPCISITWGDSDCDCMETDDFEVLCINVCNCYNNVIFQDYKIGYLYVVDENGSPVPTLPDGSPSVEIFPVGPLCFGDIGPCAKEKPTCVSRQVVIRTRGALSGKYKLQFGGICYDIGYSFTTESCFEFELCKD